MASNSHSIVEEDLLCPVCKKSLSSPGNPPKSNRSKLIKRVKGRSQNLNNSIQVHRRETLAAVGRFKDTEEITVAHCGHLFHKFCLRHYCYLFREGRHHMCRVLCPICHKNISMTSSQSIEYKIHQEGTTDLQKNYTKTSIMHSELSGQLDCETKKLSRLQEQVEDGVQNFDIFGAHWQKIKSELKRAKLEEQNLDLLKSELRDTDKLLTVMQTQHLKIVRKFIAKVKEKSPKDFIHFPKRLFPYLGIIEKDDRMVRDLGEIILPIHFNHLKSDRQSLLQEILNAVSDKMEMSGINDNRRSKGAYKPIFVESPKESLDKTVPEPPVIVRVRKSSVSIVTSSVLTRDSIDKIVENVKTIPINAKGKVFIQPPGETRISHLTDIRPKPKPSSIFCQQRQSPIRAFQESNRNIVLPPLHISPAKRPSTAECLSLTESGDCNRLGKDMLLFTDTSQYLTNDTYDSDFMRRTHRTTYRSKTS